MAYLTQMHDPIAAWLGAWSAELGLGSVALRAGLAILLASLVGLERAQKRHTAGLRTFMLVSLFSCTAMLLDLFLALPGCRSSRRRVFWPSGPSAHIPFSSAPRVRSRD